MKASIYFILFFILLASVSNGQTAPDNISKFDFQQVTFHSTECNGTCPYISINIYADKSIELSRTIYKAKGVADTTKSGNFKGTGLQQAVNSFKAGGLGGNYFPKS